MNRRRFFLAPLALLPLSAMVVQPNQVRRIYIDRDWYASQLDELLRSFNVQKAAQSASITFRYALAGCGASGGGSGT